jgi:hypothetical protein
MAAMKGGEVEVVEDTAPTQAATETNPVAKPETTPPAASADACTMDSLMASVKTVSAEVAELRKGMAAQPAALAADLSYRSDLAQRLSSHVGTFDYAGMDSAAVVDYGIKKLGLKPQSGHERTALEAYLQGASTKTNIVRVGAGMDSIAGARPAFLAKHLAASE